MNCPKCQAEMEASKRKWKTVKVQELGAALPKLEESTVTLLKCPKCGYAEINK